MKQFFKRLGILGLCAALLIGAGALNLLDGGEMLSSLTLTASAADGEDFDMPKDGDDIRALAVKHVREMVNIKWQCTETIDFSKSTDWTGTLIYRPGVQYKGVPYVSGRLDGDSDVYEFSEAIDENGYYVGPTTWQTMIGSDCGGAPRLGFAWSGALYSCSPGNDFSYFPTPDNFAKGLTPIGEYAWDNFDTSRNTTTYDCIMVPTGEAAMYECYAQMKAGDVVWSYFHLDNGTSFGEHIRFAVSDAHIEYNTDGSISPRKSYVRLVEQTSTINKNTDGSYSTWKYETYTFRELFATGYIPMTMAAYSKTSVEYPAFTTEGLNISGTVDAYHLLSGRIHCNYNIFELEATLTDADGKVVSEGISYPYMITADLSRMSFSTPLTEVPAGKYHYTLTARIGYGTKTIVDTDITYSGTDTMVVYIADNGTGNGSSPDQALGNAAGYTPMTTTSFKNSALYRAVEFLSETGGTIVVCDKVTIYSGHYYGNSTLSDFTIPGVPVDDVTIKLTSVYQGVDYRDKGASITFERTVNMVPQLELKIHTEWDNIDLVFNNQYQAARQTVIACGNKKTVFGPNVGIKVFYDGEEIEPSTASSSIFPILCGGYRYSVDPGNTNLTVLGGAWQAVVAGPCGVDSQYHGILDGSTSLTVGENAVVLTDVLGGSFDTHGSVSGDIDIRISGGTVHGDIILAGNGGVVGEASTATLTVTGGPHLFGTVKVIGPRAKHEAPKTTVLNFTDATSKAVLPTYAAADFTEVHEQVLRPETAPDTSDNTDTPPADTSDSESATAPSPLLIGILIAVILIGTVLILLLLKHQKRTP